MADARAHLFHLTEVNSKQRDDDEEEYGGEAVGWRRDGVGGRSVGGKFGCGAQVKFQAAPYHLYFARVPCGECMLRCSRRLASVTAHRRHKCSPVARCRDNPLRGEGGGEPAT